MGVLVIPRPKFFTTRYSLLTTLPLRQRWHIILQAAAVAHFGIELLASGKRLIVLNQFEDIIGHHVVAAPGHIGQRLIDDGWHHIDIIAHEINYPYSANVVRLKSECMTVAVLMNEILDIMSNSGNSVLLAPYYLYGRKMSIQEICMYARVLIEKAESI